MRTRRRPPRPSAATSARVAAGPVGAVAGSTGGRCGSPGSWPRGCMAARGGWFTPPWPRVHARAAWVRAWAWAWTRSARPTVLRAPAVRAATPALPGRRAMSATRPARRARAAGSARSPRLLRLRLLRLRLLRPTRSARPADHQGRAAEPGRCDRRAPATRPRAVARAGVHGGPGSAGCRGFSSSRTNPGDPGQRRADRDAMRSPAGAITRTRSRSPVQPPRRAMRAAGGPPRARVEPGRAAPANPGAGGHTPGGGRRFGTAGAIPRGGARVSLACQPRRGAATAFTSVGGTGGPAAGDPAVVREPDDVAIDRMLARATADRSSPSWPRARGGDVTGLSTDCYRHGDPSRTRSRSGQLNSSMFDRVDRRRAISYPRIGRESCGSLASTLAKSGTSSSTSTGHTHCRNPHHAYFTFETA
jgi:hypothetical protein